MERLIERVKLREFLYNTSSPDYRDQVARQAAWEEIGRELGIPGNTAKEKWENIRRCFCNARRRWVTKNGISKKKKSFWRFEKQMEFLTPFLENRKTHSNVDSSQMFVPFLNEPDITLSEESNTEDNMPSVKIEHDEIDYNFEAAHETGLLEPRTEDLPNDIWGTTRKRQKTDSGPVQQMVDVLKENYVLRQRKYEESIKRAAKRAFFENLDDTDLFFLSMAKMTKCLPKVDQTSIKLYVSNTVLSAELKHHQMHSQHQASTICTGPTGQQGIVPPSENTIVDNNKYDLQI